MQNVDHSHTIIDLQNVSFSYTNEEVLQNVSLQIHTGDYVGLIGPNGGGKSTLLKLMLGILTPNKGSVELFHTGIKKFKDWYKIGYVPQRTHIEMNFPVTVEEIVAMGRYGKRGLFHFPTKEDKEKTHEALKQVDMLPFASRRISDLSGGQQQRVFIARALAAEPEVIILDEPTVGVDVKSQQQFYGLLKKLNKELSLTLVLATHDINIIIEESTELTCVDRTLVYYGDPKEFKKSKHVADRYGDRSFDTYHDLFHGH